MNRKQQKSKVLLLEFMVIYFFSYLHQVILAYQNDFLNLGVAILLLVAVAL